MWCVVGFMISPITTSDLQTIEQIIAVTIRANVATSEAEAGRLIQDVEASLFRWAAASSESFHQKSRANGQVTGFIIVKEFWNLSHLFVLPEYQGQGIGRHLVTAAIDGCRHRSPRRKIHLNASLNAVGFYKTMGFQQTDTGAGRPNGCVPFELNLETV